MEVLRVVKQSVPVEKEMPRFIWQCYKNSKRCIKEGLRGKTKTEAIIIIGNKIPWRF